MKNKTPAPCCKILIILSFFAVLPACSGSDDDNDTINLAPSVSAGEDQTARQGATVNLTGAASDSDGSISSWLWRQTSGSSNITIENSTNSNAYFTAPEVDNDTTLTFELTVKDNDGISVSDSITITVRGAPPDSSINPLPSNFEAAAGDAQVTLTWSHHSSATTYNIYRSSDYNCEPANYTSCDDNALFRSQSSGFVDAGLTNGSIYYYWIEAILDGVTHWSDYPESAIPEEFYFIAESGDGQVTLTWSPHSGATTYNIYRSSDYDCDLANYTSCDDNALFSSQSSGFVDTGLTNGTIYYYWIEAILNDATHWRSGYPESAIPEEFYFIAEPGDSQVTLTWPHHSDATTYNIYRSSDYDCDLADYTSCADSALFTSQSSGFVDTGLINYTIYYYWIEAILNGATHWSDYPESAIPGAIYLKAEPGDGQVTLTWSPHSEAITYNIYRSSDYDCELANYTTCDESALFTSQSSGFVDTDLTNYTIYYYWIETILDEVTYLSDDAESAIPEEVYYDESDGMDLTNSLAAHYELDGDADDSSEDDDEGGSESSLTEYRNADNNNSDYLGSPGNYGYSSAEDDMNSPGFTLPSVSISLWVHYSDNAHSGDPIDDADDGMPSFGDYETNMLKISTDAYGNLLLAVRKNGTILLMLKMSTNSDGDLLLAVRGTGTNLPYNSVVLEGVLLGNDWYHIAATIDNNNNVVAVYFDGNQEINEQLTDHVDIDGNSIYSSSHEWNHGNSMDPRFASSLDDIRIYYRALTLAELQAIYETDGY